MITLEGVGVSEGIAFGKLIIIESGNDRIKKKTVSDKELEKSRYLNAKMSVLSDINRQYEVAILKCGKNEAEIFKVHEMMLNDKDFEKGILSLIDDESVNSEYAVKTVSSKFYYMFASMEDIYMRSRAEDITIISNMLVSALTNSKKYLDESLNKSVVFTKNVSPGEILKFKSLGVSGFVTSEGAKNSHVSILARVLGMPSIVGVKSLGLEDMIERHVAFDGLKGKIFVDPDEEILKILKQKHKQEFEIRRRLISLVGKQNITKDNKKIEICANMNNPIEIDEILKNDADGIGLFRTEFLYLNRNDFPGEDEQFRIYTDIAEKMGDKKIVIRTMDIGSDKQEDYMNFPEEENPALGYRGIRVCLRQKDIFKTQLKAIYRASVYGNFSIMFPMISLEKEIDQALEVVKEVKDDLRNDNIKFRDDVEIGIMVETPAAAIMSDVLAKKVDFFSIGTNDLKQYTLAIDRQNSMVGNEFSNNNRAVLRFIKMIADNAKKNDIKVCICGELASDKSLTELFLKMGIDKLSVSSRYVLPIREVVINSDTNNIKIDI